MVNDVVYVNFTQADEYAGHDYVMTIVDGLSRFAQFIPCKKKLDSEGAFQLLWVHWIQKYGKPKEVHSDNDVRFSSETSFWQTVLRNIRVKVSFSQPRRPQGNGLCERMNRTFKQEMRLVMSQRKDRNWIRVVPYVTWLINCQVHTATGMTPAEVFLGRPCWTPDLVPDPDAQPAVSDWLEHQLDVQKLVQRRLQQKRVSALQKANKARKPAQYAVGQYVLVHKRRFPQWTTTVFGSQWFGPYRIISIAAHSVRVRASPRVGGEVEVAHEFLKRFPVLYDDSESDEEETQAAVLEDASNTVEEMTAEEAQEEGFYHVESILKHKYRKGWFFLTKWENWSLADSTWEPLKVFVLPDGRLNEKFQEYCLVHGLERPLRDAASIAARRSGNIPQ
jgi:hypothetical protein